MQQLPAHLIVAELEETHPSLGCAGGGRGCPGTCCDPVWLPVPPNHLGELVAGDPSNPDGQWIIHHFTYDPSAEAPAGTGGWAYQCDAFVDGVCTAHEQRPPFCRKYPHNGTAVPDPRRIFLHPHCSFWLDVPAALRSPTSRPLIPLEVLTPNTP